MKCLQIILVIFGIGIGVGESHAQLNFSVSIYEKQKKCFKPGPGGIVVRHLMPDSKGGYYGFGYGSKLPPNYVGRPDFLFCHLDDQMNVEWSRVYGGSREEKPIGFVRLANGNFILAGNTESKDGDIADSIVRTRSIWVLLVDSLGNLIKKKVIGGGSSSNLYGIELSPDNSVYLTGRTIADDGDFYYSPSMFLDENPFIVRIDDSLRIRWVKMITVPGTQYVNRVAFADANSVYMGFGNMLSTDSVFAGWDARGGTDGVLMKMDSNGVTQWIKRYGGIDDDAYNDIKYIPEWKQLVLVGYSESKTGDHDIEYQMCQDPHTGKGGGGWILSLDTSGAVIHSKVLGNYTRSYFAFSGIVGLRDSLLWLWSDIDFFNGEVGGFVDPPLYGYEDQFIWLGAVDSTLVGRGYYQTKGQYAEHTEDINIDRNGDFLVSGGSAPYGGAFDKGHNTFSCDTLDIFSFILRLGVAPLGIHDLKAETGQFTIYPNPHHAFLNVQSHHNESLPYVLQIYSMQGQLVYNEKVNEPLHHINIEHWTSGSYLVKILQKGQLIYQQKYVKL